VLDQSWATNLDYVQSFRVAVTRLFWSCGDAKCRNSNQRLLGELFDASMPAVNFAITSMALGYAALGVSQTAFCLLQATTFLTLAATVATALSSLLWLLCRNRPLSVYAEKWFLLM
jgi:hypothetical protein